MSPRAHGQGVRKVCSCGWRRWPKCPHAWYFSFKPRGGLRQRFSLDAEFTTHVDSKTDAEKLASDIRSAINAGTFERVADRRAREQREAAERVARGRVAPDAVVTLDTFAPIYLKAVTATGKVTIGNDASMLDRLRAYPARDGRRLGEWVLSAITEDVLEGFHASLQEAELSASTRNQYVHVLKASFRWAARKGYLARSPISEDSTLKRTKVAQRRRRLSPEEETALLAAAGAVTRGAGLRLQWRIVAAIESGCRRGERLALQWTDVSLDKRRPPGPRG